MHAIESWQITKKGEIQKPVSALKDQGKRNDFRLLQFRDSRHWGLSTKIITLIRNACMHNGDERL